LDVVLIARVPAEGVEAFARYEDAVLPLLGEHGGELRTRLRSRDGRLELHMLRFGGAEGLEAFRADPRRDAAQPVLTASRAVVELVTVGPVPGTTPELPDGVRLAPTVAADADALLEIHASPEVARWWDPPEPGFPMADEPDAERLTIRVDGEVAGMIQYSEETEPKYRHASVDVFLGARHHGRGAGVAAVRHVVALLLGVRGHRRITIDPAAENLPAIRAYARAGFVPVGLLHGAERDAGGAGWHDTLLMELVVEP